MEASGIVLFVVSAIMAGGIAFAVRKSIKNPKERTAQAITRFGKFYALVMSWEGYHLNNPKDKKNFDSAKEPWDILKNDKNYKPTIWEKWNIYLYLWPFCKTYVYPFSYAKLKKKGSEQPGDKIVWFDDSTSEIVVSRSGISDHVDLQTEYPTITGNLFTSEMAKVLVLTNNTLLAVNPYKMLFSINNWLGVTTETISGALRGIVGQFSMQKLNDIRTESNETGSSNFTKEMLWVNDGRPGVKDGIEELWGVRLTKSVFKAFIPGDEEAKKLMDSFLKPQIATKEGEARVIEATKEGEARIAAAQKDLEVAELQKERLIKIGRAKAQPLDTDPTKHGDITELVPDPDQKVWADGISKMPGTFVTSTDGPKPVFDVRRGGGQS